ncbi:hypothetical protein QGN32_18655 [Mycolicibacterium sp. ND9-15]|uniref:hypothetical protein n=1 Tax=Mycolicibacterium sp. ND9-15 TaxID=3042320 RepID=UPI002DD9F863|nr:hypothetical protein [Mycolicibacterium sp. ND9-15]WSE55431.1 hypothetical protein QGN32_18655 [Mycolicibacterium sp. ND9-15]
MQVVRHRARRATYVKTISAAIGGGAVLGMAALGVAVPHTSGAATLAKPNMTVGATSTQTTPAKAPAVGMAVPAMKGPAPLPSEEEAAK